MDKSKATSENRHTPVSEGRPTIHNQRKRSRNISVTPDGWEGIQVLAKKHGCSSVSELVEKLGRMQLSIIESESEITQNSLQNTIQVEVSIDILKKALPEALNALFKQCVPQALGSAISECEEMTTAIIEEQIQEAQWQSNKTLRTSQVRWPSNRKRLLGSNVEQAPKYELDENTDQQRWTSQEHY